MRKSPIMRISPDGPKPDWAALETAFEHNAPDTHSYLDTKTGHVLTIVDSRPEDEEKRLLIRRNGGRYLHLDPASSREQYRWMERFVASVADASLRERLASGVRRAPLSAEEITRDLTVRGRSGRRAPRRPCGPACAPADR